MAGDNESAAAAADDRGGSRCAECTIIFDTIFFLYDKYRHWHWCPFTAQRFFTPADLTITILRSRFCSTESVR